MRTVFVGSDAVAQGRLTRHELRRWHRAVFRDVYVPSRHEVTLRDRIEGAWLRSRRSAVIAGIAASTLYGAAWVDDDIPIEVIWNCTRSPTGMIVRDEVLGDDEVTRVACLPVTSLARTAYDLGRHLPRDQAIARMDALMHATPFSTEDVLTLVKRQPGARGLRRLRAVLPLVDGGAASPKETWLRLLLIDAGFPTPTTQIPVHENWHLIALLDTGWEKYKVAAEYDGDHHRSDPRRYRRDQRRLRTLEAMGWIVIRVIAGDTPDDVIRRVRAALISRGWRP
jgi:hypothetical protein